MDRKTFKLRMRELKSYREQNPGKGYLDWKANRYEDGGETDHPTYRPEILENVEMTDPVTGKSWSSMSTEEQASFRRARSLNPYSGKQIARGNMEVISPEFDIISGIRGATNLSKHLLNDYKLRFPYAGNPNKAFRLVNPDAIDDYLKTGVVGPESKIHNAARSDKSGVFLLTKHFDNHVMFNKLKPFYGIDSKYERLLVGDLDNPRILWNKVSHKGHKGIVDPVNTITEDFTVPVSEFDIWKKLPIGWWRQLTAKSYADGGEIPPSRKQELGAMKEEKKVLLQPILIKKRKNNKSNYINNYGKEEHIEWI